MRIFIALTMWTQHIITQVTPTWAETYCLTASQKLTEAHLPNAPTPSPLNDITNTPPSQNLMNPANDKRWVRMQRPTHISDEAKDVVSLGKRGPLPIIEYFKSHKRRAMLGDDSLTPLPQTAVAGKQPRRFQWVYCFGTCAGLGINAPFKSSKGTFRHKIPPPSS